MKILVVEDGEALRDTLVRMLHICDFETDDTGDGESAIRMIDALSPTYDGVLADYIIDGPLHGTDVLEHARNQGIEKLCLMSGSQSAEDLAHALDFHFVMKTGAGAESILGYFDPD